MAMRHWLAMVCMAAMPALAGCGGTPVTIPIQPSPFVPALQMPAQLFLPKGPGPHPAVVISHGSAGLRDYETILASRLQQDGIAALLVDHFTPRGWPATRRTVSTGTTVPDLILAFRWLAARPDIDATRIGVTGFSMGGNNTILLQRPYYGNAFGEGRQFAAHVAFYPGCHLFTPDLHHYSPDPGNDTPILIMIGTRDGMATVADCEFVIATVNKHHPGRGKLIVFEGATHSWDALGTRGYYAWDVGANRGRGGQVYEEPNPRIATRSRDEAVAFFRAAFGMAP